MGIKSNISWSVPPRPQVSAQIILFTYLQDCPLSSSLKLLLLCLNSRVCKDTKLEIAYVKSRISYAWFFFGCDSSMLFIINLVVQWQGKVAAQYKTHNYLSSCSHALASKQCLFLFLCSIQEISHLGYLFFEPMPHFNKCICFSFKDLNKQSILFSQGKICKNPIQWVSPGRTGKTCSQIPEPFTPSYSFNILEPDWSFLN